MVNVAIVNKNSSQAKIWSYELSENGYKVMCECTDIYEMIDFLMREKIHIVLCSANILSENTYDALLSAVTFFSRIKIVLIGAVERSYVLVKLPNVVLKRSFDSNLDGFCRIPCEPVPVAKSPEESALALREVAVLLEPHFMTKQDTEALVSKWQPGWRADYAVMSIVADSFHDLSLSTVSDVLMPIDNVYIISHNFGEIKVLFHSLSSQRQLVSLAYKLRQSMLKHTDAAFNIGISRNRTHVDELWACAAEAHRAACSGALLGQNSVIHIGYLERDKNSYVYPSHKQKRMIEHTLNGDFDEALRMLDDIFDTLKKVEKMPQSLVNKIALGIFVDLNIAAVSKAAAFEKLQMDTVCIGDLIKAKSVDSAYDFLKNSFESFATEMADLLAVQSDILFVRLEKYIQGHPDADLDDLVRHFKTTARVINSAIYSNTGKSIFDYAKLPELL